MKNGKSGWSSIYWPRSQQTFSRLKLYCIPGYRVKLIWVARIDIESLAGLEDTTRPLAADEIALEILS
jgi:hypothetical protein